MTNSYDTLSSPVWWNMCINITASKRHVYDRMLISGSLWQMRKTYSRKFTICKLYNWRTSCLFPDVHGSKPVDFNLEQSVSDLRAMCVYGFHQWLVHRRSQSGRWLNVNWPISVRRMWKVNPYWSHLGWEVWRRPVKWTYEYFKRYIYSSVDIK